MEDLRKHRAELQEDGFTVIHSIYTDEEAAEIIQAIDQVDSGKATFRRSQTSLLSASS